MPFEPFDVRLRWHLTRNVLDQEESDSSVDFSQSDSADSYSDTEEEEEEEDDSQSRDWNKELQHLFDLYLTNGTCAENAKKKTAKKSNSGLISPQR